MLIMSIVYSAADAVSSGSWFMVLNVLTSKVNLLTLSLYLKKFNLGSVVDFSNTGARAPASAEHIPGSFV